MAKLDKKKIALIHIVKKELGLTDQQYRDILRKVSGVSSAKDLDRQGFKKLMNYFVRSNYYRVNPQGLTIKQKIFIGYLRDKLGWDQHHLLNFIRKYYHKSDITHLSRREAIKLIESLKSIAQRSKR
jgi:hypothetical protein